jgi:hypothetical protein
MGQASAGTIGDFDLVVLGSGRVVTAVTTSSGKLKVIVWDLALNNAKTATTITRRGDTGAGDAVTAVAVSGTSVSNQVTAAVRTNAGKLKVFYWDIDSEGNIEETAQTTAEDVSQVTMRRFKKTTVASAVRTKEGNLRIIVWKLDANKKVIMRQAEGDAGEVGLVSMGLINTNHPTLATAVQDSNGNLKVVLWQIARSNGYVILCGDEARGYEAVSYWHLSELNQALLEPGTKVKKGQYLGRLGNSGASSGPHLHVHAVKVKVKMNGGPPEDLADKGQNGPPTLTLAQLISKVADGTWGDSPYDTPYRPISFHNARAMVLGDVKPGGVWKNPFAMMNDDGVYFDGYAIFPGPASELPECDKIRDRIAELKSEIADLKDEIGEEVGLKPGIAAQIKKLQAEVAKLQSQGAGIGCKI